MGAVAVRDIVAGSARSNTQLPLLKDAVHGYLARLPRIVPCGEETGLKLRPGALESAITPHTRWLLLNSPSNPTGAGYHRSEIEQLMAVLQRYPRVLLLSDEIYEHIIYDQFKHVSPAAIAPALRNRILTVRGAS